MPVSNHVKGILLSLCGVLVISPDSLLIRYLTIDLWSIMFLRGIFIAITLMLLHLLLNGGKWRTQFTAMDGHAWVMVFLMAFSSFFFVAAIQTTSVAHTLIIVGAVPVFAALIGWFMLREAVSVNTRLTIAVVCSGLVLVVYDQQRSTLLGDFLALIACLSWALNFVLARKTGTSNVMFVMMLSGCVMAIFSLPFSALTEINSQQFMIGALLGALNGLALSLLIYAPRFIPSAEVAVFLPVETVLGTLLVWWFLGEYPGVVSLLAGLTIIFAIVINSAYQLKTQVSS